MSILFFNHTKKQCGVYQYGIRLFDILKKTEDINYIYIEVDNFEEYKTAILNHSPNIRSIIYNYHCATIPWLNESTIQRKVKNIGIPHESPDHLFDIVCNIDPTIPESINRFSLPRPIYENIDEMLQNYTPSTQSIKEFIEYSEDGIPIFGSFGFGFDNKGFDKIVKLVNEQYDHAIIKFVIPCSYFDPNSNNTPIIMEQKCIEQNIKPTIKLMITHEFFTTEDILKFLQSNTMNIFLYDIMEWRGISSTIDYAISVKKPLGISGSAMFKNIYSDEICLYKNSISDCLNNSVNYYSKFLTEYSHNNMILKFKKIFMRKGIFYNSKQSLCSICESGKMCYDALKHSGNFTLDYSEETQLDNSYDFAIFNHHYTVNNWINKQIIKQFNKPTFCIVTEITFGSNPIGLSPDYFDHYIVLDSSITETTNIHPFGRPIEDYLLTNNEINNEIPIIGSFGFATPGKEWHKIVECVQNDFDNATIRFNIPQGTHVSNHTHFSLLNEIKHKCLSILKKPGIRLKITNDNLSKDDLIDWCSQNTINCFFYFREHLYKAGLSAVTDQAISSGRPLLITKDCTFRHIHQYINYYPNIGIKEAIKQTQEGVLKMKKDWSSNNFLNKFEQILKKC